MLITNDSSKRLKSIHHGDLSASDPRLLIYMVFILALSFLLSACVSQNIDEPPIIGSDTDVSGEGNNNPVLVPLIAEINGEKIRIVEPGSTVNVQAQATDAEGDRLSYRWIVAPDSGELKIVTPSSIKWHVGNGSAEKRLFVVISDGEGGYAKGELKLATHSPIVFSGQVVTLKGAPISAARVDVNGEKTLTDAEGFFNLPIKDANKPRFVLNITRQGYALFSQIYDQGIQDKKWAMTEAATQNFDPTKPIVLRDILSQNCKGSLSNGIDWKNYPQQRIPHIIDTFGQLGSGVIPNDITQSLNIIFGGTNCSPGISISIPANSLVDSSGKPPSGQVEVSVSTVDLYAPNSMPGNYTVRVKDGTRWMQSYGAGSVTVQSGDQSFQLKQKASMQLTIPVDPTQLRMKAEIPPTMPLLLYNEQSGEWALRGEVTLNQEGTAYIANVNHLSAYNSDLVKSNQSCIRFRGDSLISTDATAGKYQLDAIIPMGAAAPVVRNWSIMPSAEIDAHLHAMANLPNNTWITLIPMREDAGDLIPYGIFGINSGAPQVPSQPNIPPYPYTPCQNSITLTDVGGAVDIVINGSGHNVGTLPIHLFAITNPAGTDIYPLGPSGQAWSLYGLYDSGSTKVRINDAVPNRIGGNMLSDASSWSINALASVNVRLNGLNRQASNCTLPMGAPGSASPAQVQVTGITTKPYAVDASLVGASVINQVVAHINYKQMVTTPACSYLATAATGPYMDFYLPGSIGIPSPDLVLQLERFGSMVSTDGVIAGQRYWLRNIVFQQGSNVVADDQSAPDPFDFLYDTGTTLTIINDRMANVLGLAASAGSFNCFGGTSNGYALDSVTMLSTGGSYRITNASVCWQQSAINTPAIVDAVIGSNFFDQVEVILNGPADTLGIKQ